MKQNFRRLAWVLLVSGFTFGAQAQTKQQVKRIKSGYDLQRLQTLKTKIERKSSAEKKEALRLASENGWETRYETKDGRTVEIQRVVDGQPIYYTTHNVDAAKSTRVNHLNKGGSLGLNLMGQGMTVHVWDGGLARKTHVEYDGEGGYNRFSIGDYSKKSQLNYHSAHVTGTIIASGVDPKAKGMAPHAKAVGYDWNADKKEAIGAAKNGMLVSNHSYGFQMINRRGETLPQYYFGGYIDYTEEWDQILYNAPYYLMVVAAGNDGYENRAVQNPTGGKGFDKLSGHAVCKNNLTVANAQDAKVDAQGNLLSVRINGSSSQGPTDDWRIKPDITGNGTKVYSTYEKYDEDYASITGTSMASPNVAGSLLLLQQHYNNINGKFMKASTLKGLALHTADDAGVKGPDANFGWGLMNAKRAAQAISNNGKSSIVKELTLNNGKEYTLEVESDGKNPLFASISWTDLPGKSTTIENNRTPSLVNDLDIRVKKVGGSTYLPYKLTGARSSAKKDNNVDPFERIDINNASGKYVITVKHKGTLKGKGAQNFSLIVTGIKKAGSAGGDGQTCNAIVPNNVKANLSGTSATISWSAVAGASYDVKYKSKDDYFWKTKTTSTNSIVLSDLNKLDTYELKVRSKCSKNKVSSYSSVITFTTGQSSVKYCDAKGKNAKSEYIARVQLGSIDNKSGSKGYSDFTSQSTNLKSSNTITITPKFSGSPYNEGYIVFIDYNQDGSFDDNGEIVFSKKPTKSSTVTGKFTIPQNAKKGSTRMRIALAYNKVADACGTFDYGEVEDYTVVISGGDNQAPTAPTNLVASSVTVSSVKLSWGASKDNVGVVGYKVYQNGSVVKTVKGTSVTINGLSQGAKYTFYVEAIDASDNVSNPSNSVKVTTENDNIKYCNAKGGSSSYEWIDYVAIGGMSNSSSSDKGYGNYTSKVATIKAGSITILSVSAGFKTKPYTQYWAAWIDFNKNGKFEYSERVISGSSASNSEIRTNIQIPSTAKLGKTRMRVAMKYGSAPNACGNYGYGEVEDYSVNITSAGLYTTSSTSQPIATVEVGGVKFDAKPTTDIVVYPNPAVNNVAVKLSSVLRGTTYNVVNSIGRSVKRGNLENNVINVSDLSSGVYILEVFDGQKTLTTKLIKQ